MILHAGGIIRSGSTLQYNIANEVVSLVEGNRTVHTQEKVANIVEDWKYRDGWVVNKSHNMLHYLYRDEDIQAGIFRLLLTYRDLRDVFVSTMSFRRITFELLLIDFVDMTINQELEWFRCIPAKYIRRVRYEDMYLNIAQEAIEVGKFIGIDVTEGQAQEIQSKFCIEKLQKELPLYTNMNAYSRLSKGHIQGIVHGQWKNALTEEQVRELESVPYIREWQIRNGYGVEYV